MTEDREQDRTAELHGAARPVTAAARRERRASAVASESGVARRATERDADTAAKKGRPTPKRDHREKRPSLLARLVRFFREVVGELRKVIWPTRKQQITYTAVVLVFLSFVVAVVYGLDVAFGQLVFVIFA